VDRSDDSVQFVLCSLIPLFCENVPQLALQVVFAFKTELELYQVVSMASTALSVVLSVFTNVTLAFVATNATIASADSKEDSFDNLESLKAQLKKATRENLEFVKKIDELKNKTND